MYRLGSGVLSGEKGDGWVERQKRPPLARAHPALTGEPVHESLLEAKGLEQSGQIASIGCPIEVILAQHREGHAKGAPDVVRHGALLALWAPALLLHVQSFQEVFHGFSVNAADKSN